MILGLILTVSVFGAFLVSIVIYYLVKFFKRLDWINIQRDEYLTSFHDALKNDDPSLIKSELLWEGKN